MLRTFLLVTIVACLVIWSCQGNVIKNRIRKRQASRHCIPTWYMRMEGFNDPVAIGKIVKLNQCIECSCQPTGSFICCLSRINAGKTFVYPGLICRKCRCADLPYTRSEFLSGSILEEHCFRGSGLMTCETDVCIHPLVADPNCIEVRSDENECCVRCVRSGCYVKLNGTNMEAQNNQLAIDNIQFEGVYMVKMDFGESVQDGCRRGICLSPGFQFQGGFSIENSACLEEY